MTDEPKQPWYRSLPGILTAAAGFIAALSGLVAGLNQLGVFRREPSAAAVVGVTAAPPDHTAQDSLRTSAPLEPDSAAVRPMTPPAAAQRPPAPSAAPPKPTATPKPTPSTPTRSALPADTAAAASVRVPKGTTLSLTVPGRVCAPEQNQRRFTARLASPVNVNGAPIIPAGATAVLHLRRAAGSVALRARLDSLIGPGPALALATSQVQIPRGAVAGTCLRANARITAVLGEAVTIPRS